MTDLCLRTDAQHPACDLRKIDLRHYIDATDSKNYKNPGPGFAETVIDACGFDKSNRSLVELFESATFASLPIFQRTAIRAQVHDVRDLLRRSREPLASLRKCFEAHRFAQSRDLQDLSISGLCRILGCFLMDVWVLLSCWDGNALLYLGQSHAVEIGKMLRVRFGGDSAVVFGQENVERVRRGFAF